MTAARATTTGCHLRVRAQPRASRTEVAGLHGDAVRIRVASPPVDGAANAALIEFLADRLEIPRSRLTLIRGTTGRDKTVDIQGLGPGETLTRLGLS